MQILCKGWGWHLPIPSPRFFFIFCGYTFVSFLCVLFTRTLILLIFDVEKELYCWGLHIFHAIGNLRLWELASRFAGFGSLGLMTSVLVLDDSFTFIIRCNMFRMCVDFILARMACAHFFNRFALMEKQLRPKLPMEQLLDIIVSTKKVVKQVPIALLQSLLGHVVWHTGKIREVHFLGCQW